MEREAAQPPVFIYISQSHFLPCTKEWRAKRSQWDVMATKTLMDCTDTHTRTRAEPWEHGEQQEFEMELWGTMTPSGCYYASESTVCGRGLKRNSLGVLGQSASHCSQQLRTVSNPTWAPTQQYHTHYNLPPPVWGSIFKREHALLKVCAHSHPFLFLTLDSLPFVSVLFQDDSNRITGTIVREKKVRQRWKERGEERRGEEGGGGWVH